MARKSAKPANYRKPKGQAGRGPGKGFNLQEAIGFSNGEMSLFHVRAFDLLKL
jgi:hypothetical protein